MKKKIDISTIMEAFFLHYSLLDGSTVSGIGRRILEAAAASAPAAHVRFNVGAGDELFKVPEELK
jgi:hypothetical protein